MGATLKKIVGNGNNDFQIEIGSNKLMVMMRLRNYVDYVIFKTELNEQQIIPAFH
jgi:hypothetical protein